MDCGNGAIAEIEKVDVKPAYCDKTENIVIKDNNMPTGQTIEQSSLNAMSSDLKLMECDKIVESAGSSVQTPEESNIMSDSAELSKASSEEKILEIKDEIAGADSINESAENDKEISNHLAAAGFDEMPNQDDKSNDISHALAEALQPGCSSTRFPKLKSKVKKRHYRKKSTDTDDAKTREKKPRDNEETDANVTPENNQTKQSDVECKTERVRSPRSSKSSNSDHEGGDSSDWTTASEDELNGTIPYVLQKEQPKPKIFIVPEVINRQIGNAHQFERRFYGSLHVVQRLELMEKLQEHEVGQFRKRGGCVNALNFNRQGNLLASASDDLQVVIWDWAIGKKRHVFETGHKSNVFESKWLPLDFENYVATCARDGQVRLLDICVGVHRKLANHHGPARRLGIHPDHPYTILSVGDDAKVMSIDIRDERPSKLLTAREGRTEMPLYSIHINPRNSNEFCVSGHSQVVKIYDRRKVTTAIQRFCPERLMTRSPAVVTCALYNYNGTEIIASYNDDDIYLFDTMVTHPSGDFAHRYQGHRNNATVKSVNFFGPKSEFIVSGSDCGNIFFWDKNTEAIVQWFPGDEQGIVNRVETHPSVPIMATSGLDSDIKIWVPSCEQAPTFNMLEACVKLNHRNRSDNIANEPDNFDWQMLMTFLHRIRQHEGLSGLLSSRSRFATRQEEDESDSSSDSPSEGAHEGHQCATS